MDGAHRAFASPTKIGLAGKDYTVRPRIAEHYAEFEDHLLSLRENPLVAAKEMLALVGDDPVVVKQILEVAMAQRCHAKSITRQELSDWMDSLRGMAYVAWVQLRHNDPDYDSENPLGSCKTITPETLLADIMTEFEGVLKSVMKNTTLTGQEAADAAESLLVDRIQADLGRPSGEDGLGNSTGPNLPPSTAGEGQTTSEPSPGGES